MIPHLQNDWFVHQTGPGMEYSILPSVANMLWHAGRLPSLSVAYCHAVDVGGCVKNELFLTEPAVEVSEQYY